MQTLGYILILVAVLLTRQVFRGRTMQTPDDFRDMFVAFLHADPQGITEVLARPSADTEATFTDASSGALPPTSSNNDLVSTMQTLGSRAKGYQLGATGPDYYDCSGLVWRACRQIGVYRGARFTTFTFTAIAKSWCTQVSSPAAGCIVLWANHHMGVATGGDGMYSARSTSKGIGPSTISGDSDFFGFQPTYWQVN